jgi:hypothetical protein
MHRGLLSLLIGIAALGAIATAADARDGCGRGLYYNGFRCVPERDYYGPPPDRWPLFMFVLNGRDDQRYFPPSRRYNTRKGCPPRYTVQDGLCKPYTGR